MKKVFMTIATCALVATAITSTSCTKESDILQQGANNRELPLTAPGDEGDGNGNGGDPNPTNPFNAVGEMHNALLLEVGMAIENEINNFAQRETITYATQDSMAQLAIATLEDIIANDTRFSTMNDFLVDNPSFISTVVMNHDMGTPDTMTDLIVAKTTSILSTMSPTLTDEMQLVRIQSLADSVLFNAPNNVDTCAAAYLTVLRYSLDFWQDALDNTSNPWHNLIIRMDDGQEIDTSVVYTGLLKKIGEAFHAAYQKVATLVSGIFCNHTWKNIGLCDAWGAGIGAAYGFCTGGLNPVYILCSTGITAVGSSLLGPFGLPSEKHKPIAK